MNWYGWLFTAINVIEMVFLSWYCLRVVPQTFRK